MSFLTAILNPLIWWGQFPIGLRLITRIRLLASIGAGGVIYLTPLVFNQVSFSATDIGIGIAAAAFVGTFSRFLSGGLLDRRLHFSRLVLTSSCLAILSDFYLLQAQSFGTYLGAQLLLGVAAGLYWPAIEIAVPLGCGNFPSRQGYALVRSADALGMGLGTLLGTISALIGLIRFVYIIDVFFMLLVIFFLINNPLFLTLRTSVQNNENSFSSDLPQPVKSRNNSWLFSLFPVLVVSFISTLIFALLQSALPLDLVKGGLLRAPMSEAWSSSVVSFQLLLLVLLQWPVGRWLSTKEVNFGLKVSLFSFSVGCLLTGISSLLPSGALIVFASQIPFSFGLAAFLPTATQAVLDTTPKWKRGIGMALFSQCFALTALISPLIAGNYLDFHQNAFGLWLIMGVVCFMSIPILKLVKPLPN